MPYGEQSSQFSSGGEPNEDCELALEALARLISKAILGSASVDGATMEEKAAEGNVAYFAEFPSEELDRKLTRHRDEDERTLLHIAAAAGARASPSPDASNRRVPRSPPPTPRRSPSPLLSNPAPAGKTDLVELFLATDAGRALVNKGDEVRRRP